MLFLAACLSACSLGRDTRPAWTETAASGSKDTLSGAETASPLPQDSPKPDPSPDARELVMGSYFKAGDFRYHMELSAGGFSRRDALSLLFSKKDPQALDWSNARTELSEYFLPLNAGTGSFQVEQNVVLTLNPDGSVTLADGTDASGDYYSYKDHLIMPDAFKRPLNSADLIGLTKTDMQLMRNEFYAVYGREFKKEELKSYFESQPWYRGTTGAGQFKEELLGGLFKRNILYLKTAEDLYKESQAAVTKAAYENLEPAPYLNLLPEHGEIYVNIDSLPKNAVDKGIYYAARGTLSVPVTLTVGQYEQLNRGEAVELTLDEITGETGMLRKARNPSLGEYVFREESGGNYVMASYYPETGFFTLWHDSDDTVFKRVYEGELFILKGAMEEYYAYFDLPASGRENTAGVYRRIDFEEDSPDPLPYSGNYLARDSKGYIKALYFVGD